jgi:hypothetical protein
MLTVSAKFHHVHITQAQLGLLFLCSELLHFNSPYFNGLNHPAQMQQIPSMLTR